MDFNKYLVFLFVFVLLSCDKDEKEEILFDELRNGYLVLNEGLFQHNNSTVSWLDKNEEQSISDIFLRKSGRNLGDTGNDMKRYGGKIYIAVTTSSTLEIQDARTFENLRQIKLHYQGVAQQPRNMVFHSGKVYVSSFDGFINVIDTMTYAIERIPVGKNPDHLVIAENTLLVSNSGGLNFPEMDSTVFAIDLSTHQLTDSFVIGKNPGSIVYDGNNGAYVVRRGNYSNIPSELFYIDLVSKSVESMGVAASSLVVHHNNMYVVDFNSTTHDATVSTFDLVTKTITTNQTLNFENHVQTFYGLFPQDDGSFLVLDAMSFTNQGFLRFFDENGTYQKSVRCGLNPTKLIKYD